MDPNFLIHNTHLEDPNLFAERDPQLRRLRSQPYQHYSSMLLKLPRTIPGIYTLGGGRQIGKTTLVKQWMQELLLSGVNPNAIAFFSGELIDDHHQLFRYIQRELAKKPEGSLHYLIIDEVTYIRDWDKAVKYAADGGLLDHVILLVTGSDLVLMQEARMRFPGRRGKSAAINFHLYPLSFREMMQLKHPQLKNPTTQLLFEEFHNYMVHGGFLTALNDLAQESKILPSTLITYSDWIRGDVLKRGKQEHYLKEILQAIIKRYGSQVTWNALSKDLSIDHPKTIADYIHLLESMDAVFIQEAILEDKLTAAPKKARKVMFADPFIYHAIQAWLTESNDPYTQQIQPLLINSKDYSNLVECCVATHYRRYFSTYYIKAEGEVDIAYVNQNRFWPIEIKWTEQLRDKDLKQILKYPNGLILTKNSLESKIHNIPTMSVPQHLWALDPEVNETGVFPIED